MEELDGNPGAFYSFRAWVFVMFALAMSAVMSDVLSEFYEYIKK